MIRPRHLLLVGAVVVAGGSVSTKESETQVTATLDEVTCMAVFKAELAGWASLAGETKRESDGTVVALGTPTGRLPFTVPPEEELTVNVLTEKLMPDALVYARESILPMIRDGRSGKPLTPAARGFLDRFVGCLDFVQTKGGWGK